MIGHCNWNLKLRHDRQRHPANAVVAIGVGDAVGKACIAVIARPARKDGRAAIHNDRAIIAVEQFDDCKAVAFNVAVVHQQCNQIDDERYILFADKYAVGVVTNAIGIGNWSVVDR
jgi:hypothetical protein